MELISFQPISKQDALTLCNRFRHLIGKPFDADVPGKGIIEAIVPAPWDEKYQWQFAQYFKEHKDGEKCLKFYEGDRFMPLILATPLLRKLKMEYKDLRLYLFLNRISISCLNGMSEKDSKRSV